MLFASIQPYLFSTPRPILSVRMRANLQSGVSKRAARPTRAPIRPSLAIVTQLRSSISLVAPHHHLYHHDMNVLYLLSDDMRADVGAYGISSVVHTPNLNRLASSSLLFQHAYSQISVCSPSRQSFMTGLRPDTNKVFNFIDSNPLDTQAIPGHFRNHGYLTLGLGKTFHEEQGSWNADRYFNTTGRAGRPYYKYKANECPVGNEGGGQCIIRDEDIYDYHLRKQTIEYLKHAADWSREEDGKPFFLISGFRDPHAPWAAPKRMYDLYDEDDIDLPPSGSKTLGKDCSPAVEEQHRENHMEPSRQWRRQLIAHQCRR